MRITRTGKTHWVGAFIGRSKDLWARRSSAGWFGLNEEGLCSDARMREGEALTRKKQMRLMISRLFGYFMPSGLLEATAEEIRRGRLIIGFGILGAIFGTVYAAFYLAISHPWGAFIVLVCSSCFVMIPGYLRRTAQLARAGNLYCMVLTAGFFCLCWVEGGINGHALAWLVVSPLCAVLLVPRRITG